MKIICIMLIILFGGAAMAEDDISIKNNTITDIETSSITFTQSNPYPQLMIHEDLDEAKIKEIQDTYSYDKGTTKIMLDFYKDAHYMTRLMSLVADLINLNKETTIKLLIKYKISFTDKEGNKIGYESTKGG